MAGGNPCFQLAENRAFAERVGQRNPRAQTDLSAPPRGKGGLHLNQLRTVRPLRLCRASAFASQTRMHGKHSLAPLGKKGGFHPPLAQAQFPPEYQ